MRKYIIKNADGSEQTVMQAIHNSRKEAAETLMDYIRGQNDFWDIDDDDYLSPFDFVLEEVECKDVNETITDFESARKALGGKPNEEYEECLDSDGDYPNISGHLTISVQYGRWVFDFDKEGINGRKPQDTSFTEAAIKMAEFCIENELI